MTTGIKYALLWLPTHYDYDAGVWQLLPDMISWRGKLSDLMAAEAVRYWKPCLGEFDWRFFDEESRLVLVSTPSGTANVTDGETKRLRDRLGLAANAMLLAGPASPYHGVARCIHGEALSAEPPVRLKNISSTFNLEQIQRPYYDQRRAFSRIVSSTPALWQDRYLERWRDLVLLLDRIHQAGLPRILNVAFQAFQVALARTSLEFAIPEFIRSVECIVGLEQRQGAKVFADRAMRLARPLEKHWYVGGQDLQSRIRDLYDHRSECVHGKIPFEMLLSLGDAGKDEAARFGYLAEALARESLLRMLKSQQCFPYFKDRATLEDAWRTNKLP